MRVALLALILLALAGPASAQFRTNSSWLGVQVLGPIEDAGDLFETGFAATATTQWVRTPRFDWLMEGGWYWLPGADGEGRDIDDISAPGLLFGGLLHYGPLQIGFKGGYYFLDLHEWDGVPLAQLTLGRFAIGAEAKAFGTTRWGAGFLKFRW